MEEQQAKRRINAQALGMPIDELPRVSLEGAEIVRRQYLSHIKEAILTVRPDGIMFNNSCIAKMEEVSYIHMMIIRSKKLFIIRACKKGDKDGQRWCNVKKGKRESRKITGREACTRIYNMMGWNRAFYYKICGTPALQADNEDELLIVFDLTETERYLLTEKGRAAAGVKEEDLTEDQQLEVMEAEEEQEKLAALAKEKKTKKKPTMPKHWNEESFGVPIEEHQSRIVLPLLSDEVVEQSSLFDYGMVLSEQR